MAKKKDEEVKPKVPATRFKKGVSGNPKGRPKGAKGKAAELRKKIEGEAIKEVAPRIGGLLKQAIEKAEAGDGSMQRFLIKHFVPAATYEESQKGGTGQIVINVQAIDPIEVIEGETIDS